MERKGKHIENFKPGNIIVRLQAATYEKNTEEIDPLTSQPITVTKELNSYRGEPLEFIGIYNNMIVVKILTGGYKGSTIEFDPYRGYGEGWGLYEDYDKQLIRVDKSQNN